MTPTTLQMPRACSTEWLRPFSRAISVTTSLPIRDLAIAAMVVVAASAAVYAEEHIQDWIPDALTFPSDAQVVTDREIGASNRLFSISTGADVDALLDEWENDLNENGYPVTQETGELVNRSIEFTGPGIANAKIIATPISEEGQNLIAFDATLD